ncbi:hypothetical protein V8C26DRAFT_402311, partial [Trichoderma gracile]
MLCLLFCCCCCLALRLRAIKTEPRMELAVPVCRNRCQMHSSCFRSTTLPFLPLPCLTRLVTTQIRPLQAIRRDETPAMPGLGTALPWQHGASSSFFPSPSSSVYCLLFLWLP